MKRAMCLLIAITLLAGLMIASPGYAGDGSPPPSPLSEPSIMTAKLGEAPSTAPPGELIIVDCALLRPLGIAAMGIGLGGAIVALPFAATTGNFKVVGNELIMKPFIYTFKRPLGQMDYAYPF